MFSKSYFKVFFNIIMGEFKVEALFLTQNCHPPYPISMLEFRLHTEKLCFQFMRFCHHPYQT